MAQLLDFPVYPDGKPKPELITADAGTRSHLNPVTGKLEWVPDDEPNDDDNVDQ